MEAWKHEILYTTEYIEALPEGERAELIDGRIYYMSSTSRTHQQMLGYLYHEIYDYIKDKKGCCEVNLAPFAVYLNKDNKNYVEPDISVVCDKEKLDDKGCHGAPDWVIEIVSPRSKDMDYLTKLIKYNSAGVREYWIVDTAKACVTVYNFERETKADYAFGENVPAGIYEDFCIKVQQDSTIGGDFY